MHTDKIILIKRHIITLYFIYATIIEDISIVIEDISIVICASKPHPPPQKKSNQIKTFKLHVFTLLKVKDHVIDKRMLNHIIMYPFIIFSISLFILIPVDLILTSFHEQDFQTQSIF